MIVKMNGPYSISNCFILLFKTYFIVSELQFYIPESITLLNCQCNASWPSAFLKRIAAVEITVVSDCMMVI